MAKPGNNSLALPFRTVRRPRQSCSSFPRSYFPLLAMATLSPALISLDEKSAFTASTLRLGTASVSLDWAQSLALSFDNHPLMDWALLGWT